MRHAARWETSRRDLAAKLEQKLLRRCERSGEDPEDWRARIPDVVARLAEQGYVDDRRLGRLLVARLRREGRSTQRILAQLERRGVPDEIARELVEDLEPAAAREREIDAAFRLARRRRIGPYTPDPDRREADRERHLAILGRQGFSLETALCVVDAESPGSLE
ncbi:MAG: RecX family transcriptional regulator [Spirochaetaceae bacterium]|nr:RecX family transcriptional regulator [Myxococcales bacterium]MCB9726489.1 RecX family transcriptional regulator [Spirochaetaceae bacterium]HPG27620.1 RecX family transcriptional regulator [Myxococcota bacterium]